MALITVTANFGSGGEKIARRVSKELGLDFYNDPKLQEKALAMGISHKDLEGFDEKAPRLFDRLFTTKPALYLDLLGSVVYDVASKGNGVIVGHGSQIFLKDFNCAFHIMIHASEETRSRRLTRENKISEEAAADLVRRMDKRLEDFSRYAFKRDWNDPSGYDLMINLDKIGEDWAVKLITELAGSDEIKTCSLKALEEMEASSLQRKVEAVMIKNDLTTPFTNITVHVHERGKVHLTGWTYGEDERSHALKLARDVPGVSQVTSDIIVQLIGE